ncbi:hypothetical protein IFT92_23130 [Peribacillus simplex]|uniref:hypothetical protein n=1 Tax=Peribacillus simplex TaxID=1478 RepID=UPI0019228D19|nr:hypothetical protein [Peribacillus simplex]MBD8590636.1 hypothetical protein [Peribacillus simplex]
MFLFQEKLYKVEIEWALSDTEKFLKPFFNLLKNAIEAMDEFQGKGKIRIEHYYKNGEIHIKVS